MSFCVTRMSSPGLTGGSRVFTLDPRVKPEDDKKLFKDNKGDSGIMKIIRR